MGLSAQLAQLTGRESKHEACASGVDLAGEVQQECSARTEREE
jgi:hypothetical protein